MILPILIYSSNVWYPIVQCCKTLEKIQEESLRWINGDRNYLNNTKKNTKILSSSYTLPPTPRSTDNVKMVKRHYDYNFNDYICLRDSDRLLRSSDCLRFDNKKPKKKICRDSFFYRTGALINRLPKTANFKIPQRRK